jgi:hypothetical protein
MKSKNQKGFGAIEGLLIVIALTLVVGVGFYVMNTSKDVDKNLKETTSASEKQQAKIEYIKVPLLGVKIVSTTTVKDVSFNADLQDASIVDASDSELTSLTNACFGSSSSDVSFMQLTKGSGDFSGRANKSDNAVLLKQFKSFYIAQIKPSSLGGDGSSQDCTDGKPNTAASARSKALTNALEKAFEKSVEI